MDSQDIKELQQEVMEELGISMEELQEIIDKEVENSEWVRQRKQQLEELEQCMRHKEEEVAHVDQLIDDAMRCVRGPGASRNSEEGDVRRGLPIPFRANPRGVCVVNEVNTDNYPPPRQASSPFLWPLALGWLRSGKFGRAQPLSLPQGHRQVRDAGQGIVLHDRPPVPGEQLRGRGAGGRGSHRDPGRGGRRRHERGLGLEAQFSVPSCAKGWGWG